MATSATQIAKTGKYGDLRRRLVFLLLALVVYRIGAHIPVPGINPDQLRQLFEGQQGGIARLIGGRHFAPTIARRRGDARADGREGLLAQA